MYKIPSFDDIPCDFRVTLYDRTSGPTIRASKGVGEPPLFGAASVSEGESRTRNGVSCCVDL